MKKNKILVAILAACVTLSSTLGGCSLISKNTTADMAQDIAVIDIRNSKEKFDKSDLKKYEEAITPSTIKKRDLVSYFINVGSQYVSEQGKSYEETFNMLLDALIDNAVLTQYATLYLLSQKGEEAIAGYKACKTESEKYEYLLSLTSPEQVKVAKYKFYSSINSAIDSFEKEIIEEEKEFTGTGTRTTPTNLNTEQDDYYPKDADGNLDYYIYVGYENYLLSDSKRYKEDAIEGTTRATRIKAYNTFINNLKSNDLIGEEEMGKLTDVVSLNYIQDEYVSQLEARVVATYYDLYEKTQEDALTRNNYEYINDAYSELLIDQKGDYSTVSKFESALSGMNSSSFVLYNPDVSDSEIVTNTTKNSKFGFVYNILLPFNARQSAKLAELTKIKEGDKNENYYYYERNKLLKEITTEDQRSAWFNGETKYAFNATSADSKYKEDFFGKDNDREYLFFEGNLSDSGEGKRYKTLQAYDGRYSYNGTVYENKDGSYTLIGNKLTIDGMLNEFSSYVNYVLGKSSVTINKTDGYYDTKDFSNTNMSSSDKIDYTKLLYAQGRVNFGTFNKSDLMTLSTPQYKAMSAVNELQFAYTTDTGVLSNYVGYSVSAYSTSYIKEFEYAAKLAVVNGEGSFTVCAGDYGWHLIYATYVFDFGSDGSVYSPNWAANIEKKGTFENLFYEYMKSKDLSDISSSRRNKIIFDFGMREGDNKTVTKYQKKYQNLLDLDKNK